MLGLRVLHGLSWAVSSTSIMTAATDTIATTRRGEGMGWFSTSMTLAMAIGPLLGIWVIENLSYRALFLFAVILSGITLLLIIGIKTSFQAKSTARKIELFEVSVLSVATSVFFLFIAYGGITTFVPLFADSIQVNSGAFFLAFAATLALSRPVSGKLADRFGESIVIIPALAFTVLALLVLGFSTNLIGILVSAVLYGIGFGSAQPALQAALLRLSRSDRKGVANATLATAADLGIGIGAIILGWISQNWSYQALFAVSAVSVVFSMLLFVFFVKRLLNNAIDTVSEFPKQVDG